MTDQWALVKDGFIIEYRDYAPVGDQSLLAAGKPRMLPVVEENADYDPVSQVRDGPDIIVEAAQVVRRFTVRAKSADEVAAMRAAKVAQVKSIAENRITAIMPEYAQRNALARGLELVTTYGQAPSEWPSDAQAEYAQIMSAWGAIKAIRAKSDQKEAEVAALQTSAEIASYDAGDNW